jgi:hypothetical protein
MARASPRTASWQRSVRRLASPLAAIALAAAVSITGCGARYARVPLVQTPELVVTLRSERRGGESVAKGFAHPAAISASRLESILSRVDVRESGKDAEERRAAFAPALVPTLASALAGALARADATQEVALRAERRERKLGVFTRRFATSFVAYVDAQNRLVLQLVDADRELPAGDDAPLPEPIAGRGLHPIKALPGPHVAAIGPRAVAVDWRADLFAAPPARGDGSRKRTILMESPGPRAAQAPPESDAASDPARLRALADLEEARRAGRISEAEYQRQRAALHPAARE